MPAGDALFQACKSPAYLSPGKHTASHNASSPVKRNSLPPPAPPSPPVEGADVLLHRQPAAAAQAAHRLQGLQGGEVKESVEAAKLKRRSLAASSTSCTHQHPWLPHLNRSSAPVAATPEQIVQAVMQAASPGGPPAAHLRPHERPAEVVEELVSVEGGGPGAPVVQRAAGVGAQHAQRGHVNVSLCGAGQSRQRVCVLGRVGVQLEGAASRRQAAKRPKLQGWHVGLDARCEHMHVACCWSPNQPLSAHLGHDKQVDRDLVLRSIQRQRLQARHMDGGRVRHTMMRCNKSLSAAR